MHAAKNRRIKWFKMLDVFRKAVTLLLEVGLEPRQRRIKRSLLGSDLNWIRLQTNG
jgi:hypothetical protein